jgi:hypothetical protein
MFELSSFSNFCKIPSVNRQYFVAFKSNKMFNSSYRTEEASFSRATLSGAGKGALSALANALEQPRQNSLRNL